MAFSWSALVERIASLTGSAGGDVTVQIGQVRNDGSREVTYADLAQSSDRTVVTSTTGSRVSGIANTTVLASMGIDDMYYKLVGHEVVQCSQEEYLKETRRRHESVQHQGEDPWRVDYTIITDPRSGENYDVSTVFLALDHGYAMDEDEPVVFETLATGPMDYEEMMRYQTWDAAVAGHLRQVTAIREFLVPQLVQQIEPEKVEYKTKRKLRLRRKD